jgi:hypothetical protein
MAAPSNTQDLIIFTVAGSRSDRSEQHPEKASSPISARTAGPGKTTRSNRRKPLQKLGGKTVIPSGKKSSRRFRNMARKARLESASGRTCRKHKEKTCSCAESAITSWTLALTITRDGPVIRQFPSLNIRTFGNARKSNTSLRVIVHPGDINVIDGAPDTLSKALNTPLSSTFSLLTLIALTNVLHWVPSTI